MSHVEALDAAGIPEVIEGKAIYENRVTLNQLATLTSE